MLKKISKIFPILFLVASLGVLIVTNPQFVGRIKANTNCHIIDGHDGDGNPYKGCWCSEGWQWHCGDSPNSCTPTENARCDALNTGGDDDDGWEDCGAEGHAGEDTGSYCEPNGVYSCGEDHKRVLCTNNTWELTGECCESPGAEGTCQAASYVGRCEGNILINCRDGEVQEDDCGTDTCGLSGGIYQCISGEEDGCNPACIPWNASTDSCGDAVIRCPIECSGLSRTYYCTGFTCSDKGGVTAERCDDQAVAWENGGGASGSSNIQDGKILYQDELLPKDCFVKQTDYYASFNGTTPEWSTYKGHSMGNRSKSLDECSAEPEPLSLSGRVYCQDPDDQAYPLPNITMTIIRNILGNTEVNTSADGTFTTDLTGETGLFAVRLPIVDGNWTLPSGQLSNGQPYSALLGPTQIAKTQCDSGYEMCDPTAADSNDEFDFHYTNCTTAAIAPTCNTISMLDSAGTTTITDYSQLSPGQTIKFQCSANNPDGADVYYQFNIAKHNPTTGVYSSIINSPTDISSSIISSNITIDSTGDYYAQCRVCTDTTEASCQEWEQTPLPPGCPPQATSLICDDDTACIACYGQPVSCTAGVCQIPTGIIDLD